MDHCGFAPLPSCSMVVYSENQGREGTEWRLTAGSITSFRSSVRIEKDSRACPGRFVYNSQNVSEDSIERLYDHLKYEYGALGWSSRTRPRRSDVPMVLYSTLVRSGSTCLTPPEAESTNVRSRWTGTWVLGGCLSLANGCIAECSAPAERCLRAQYLMV